MRGDSCGERNLGRIQVSPNFIGGSFELSKGIRECVSNTNPNDSIAPSVNRSYVQVRTALNSFDFNASSIGDLKIVEFAAIYRPTLQNAGAVPARACCAPAPAGQSQRNRYSQP
jgi:hypothetical protein